MRHKAFWTAAVLLLAASVSAQSLGEVAKKEKERRKKLQESGASKVITETDLSGSSSAPAGSTAEPETGEGDRDTDSAATGRRPAIPDQIDPVPKDPSVESGESDPWPAIFAEYQKDYRDAKAWLDFLVAFDRHCKQGTPPPPLPPVEGGGYWMVNCDSFGDDIARAQTLLKKIQDTCHEHARRMGVPPGRARLS